MFTLAGTNHELLMSMLPAGVVYAEPFIGYTGVSLQTHHCFETYPWMHHIYGRLGIENGWPLDTVITDVQDPAQFHEGDDGDYLLYVGRMIQRKGVADAAEIARIAEKRLVMAGTGARQEGSTIICDDGTVLHVDKSKRTNVMIQTQEIVPATLHYFQGL